MGPNGWPFANVDSFPEADVDPVNNANHVRDIYFKANPDYGGK
jgi:putative glutathione S-transferase